MPITNSINPNQTIFDRMRQDARASGIKAGFQAGQSIEWLLGYAKQMNDGISILELAKSQQQRDSSVLGSMMVFLYDPKLKATLPYYDTLPIVFPIARYDDGFLGINLHYLSPRWRLFLLNTLQNLYMSGNQNTLALTYAALKNFSNLKIAQPCLKRYLSSHVRSRFIRIPKKEWPMAVVLPMARFQKQSQQFVWEQSQAKVSKARNK